MEASLGSEEANEPHLEEESGKGWQDPDLRRGEGEEGEDSSLQQRGR